MSLGTWSAWNPRLPSWASMFQYRTDNNYSSASIDVINGEETTIVSRYGRSFDEHPGREIYEGYIEQVRMADRKVLRSWSGTCYFQKEKKTGKNKKRSSSNYFTTEMIEIVWGGDRDDFECQLEYTKKEQPFSLPAQIWRPIQDFVFMITCRVLFQRIQIHLLFLCSREFVAVTILYLPGVNVLFRRIICVQHIIVWICVVCDFFILYLVEKFTILYKNKWSSCLFKICLELVFSNIFWYKFTRQFII